MSGRAETRTSDGPADGSGDRRPLPVDYLLAGYLALTGALALASLEPAGLALAATHAVAVWVLLGPLAGVGRPEEAAGKVGPDPDGSTSGSASEMGRHVVRFVRVVYPVLLTPVLYTELELLNQLHVHGFLDPVVQDWEEAVFGAQLSVVWAELQPWRWLSELMHLGYFSYYLLIPVSAVLVYRRAGQRELHRFAMITGLGFFLCYLAFVVFPVTGPRYLFEPLQGEPARALLFDAVHAIAQGGSSKGTAFPSSHVAATVAAWLGCRRAARRWFRVSAPFVFLLTLGTVYGRFHYAVDAVAGVAVGVVAWKLGPVLERRLSGSISLLAGSAEGASGERR